MAIRKEDLIKLPWWQKLLILVGLIVFVGVLWYFLLLAPTREQIAVVSKDIQKLKADIREQEKAKEAKRILLAQIKELEEQLVILRSKLPEEKEIPTLLSTVTELGRLNGLDFALFKQDKPVRKEHYSEIPVEIQVSGGYHQVALFLYRVGSMDRILHVSSLRMGKYKASDGGGELVASMRATTYKYETQPLSNETEKGKPKTKR